MELQIKKNIALSLHLHNLQVEKEILNIFESIIQQSVAYQEKLIRPKVNAPQKK